MDWVTNLASEISALGGRLYLVGGAVRDLLMGKEPHDFDYCVTGIAVGDFQKLLPGAKMHGKAFPVLDFRRREFAFARKEIKTGTGHKGFDMISNKDISIEDDLKRRDITINSIAMDILTEEIIDPYNGRQDIERQIIRATSDAFVEDPLRTYRVARFASQLDFRIESNTFELMQRTKEELDTLSPERVYTELEKALKSPKPSAFFETLKQANLLDVHFEEVQNLIGVVQPVLYHPEGDAYNHTMQVIDKMAQKTHEPHIIFAGLVHDLGKALTPPDERPRHIGHEERGIELVKNLSNRLKLPTKYEKAGITACKEHMKAGLFNEMRTAKKVDFIERLSKSVLTLEGIEILASADNTKNTKIGFAEIGKEMLEKINAKEYPKNMDYNIIKENLRRDRIDWLNKKIKVKEYKEMNYKNEIAKRINAITNIDIASLESYIEVPPNTELGDFAFPCFKLAKELKKAPPMIANELKEKLSEDEVISKIDVVGGYLNFFINKSVFVKNVLTDVLAKGDDYGKSDVGNGKTIVIDYSSPNIAKPFHIGHLRSTVIGGALYKMYKAVGYNVVGINHLGDWGMGISKMIAGYEMWKDEYIFDENAIYSILAIYVRFNKLEKEDPGMTDKARDVAIRLESNDEETIKLWKWIVGISLENYNKVYELLGSEFDSFNGEAFYYDKTDRVVAELENKGLLKYSEGAKVVEMPEENMPPCIIITSAGTTIYAARDLAALLYRIDTYDFEKAIYVVGSEQALHFKQVFKTLELMGYEKYAASCEHIPFGLVLDENGEKIGSRKGGKLPTLEELLNESIEKSLQIIEEKNPTLENKEEVAKMVGVGAIIFNDLSNNRIKDEIFDWNQLLNFTGETGPYLQYTYVRTNSIMKNANADLSNINTDELLDKEAIEVIRKLAEYPDIVLSAVNKNEPSLISRHLIDLAQSFSRFYNEHQIICDNEETKKARVALTKAVGTTIKNGLALLGIKSPEKM